VDSRTMGRRILGRHIVLGPGVLGPGRLLPGLPWGAGVVGGRDHADLALVVGGGSEGG
jgi:hypothetical protein